NAPAVVRAIEADRSTVSVSLNYIMRLYGEPGTEIALQLEQYALAKMQLPQAHGLAQGGDVLVAIVDGSVDASHPELQGVIEDTFDAAPAAGNAHSHGTAVAGAIAAHARLKGSAPAARILAAQAVRRGQDRRGGDGSPRREGYIGGAGAGRALHHQDPRRHARPKIGQAPPLPPPQGRHPGSGRRQQGPAFGPALPGRQSGRDRGDRDRPERQG